jgi:putative transposase
VRRFGKAVGYMPPRDRVNRLMYNRALSTLNEHLIIPSASNSHFKPEQLIESLLYLSVEERYAESGLEDLACTREAPSADTLLYRLKKIESRDAYKMLIQANDSVIEEVKSKGVFGRPVVAAIDYTDDPYYGEYNSLLRRGKRERGTDLYYTYASLHIVEAGKRITIFTRPVYQLEDHASIVEELVKAAHDRGVRIHTLLIDRGFYTIDVMNILGRLRVRYIMPAVKNSRIKRVIEDYHNHLIPNMVKLTMRRDNGEEASFGLIIHPKKDAKDPDPIHERYIVFATNMKYSEAFKLYPEIPEEYRKRWGVETGFRVQNTIKAKTTSTNYTIRLLYHMLSTILYNIWMLANITLMLQLKRELTKPLIKLTQMTRIFRLKIELNKPP